MPITLTWSDIAIRLLCTILAGGLIGFDRTARGRAAGLRTMTLVSLAACLSMIQVNLLLSVAGKSPTSFVVLDLMRLPLGILSGMGFIGAGAIILRDNLVVGVTTAAAMWFVTVIGLCFGAGQILLGTVGAVIGFGLLALVTKIEDWTKQDHLGRLLIHMDDCGPAEDEIRSILEEDGFKILSVAFTKSQGVHDRELSCELQWRARAYQTQTPHAVHLLSGRSSVMRVAWTPQGR